MNNGKTFSGYEWFSVLNETMPAGDVTGTAAQQDVYSIVLNAVKTDTVIAQQIVDLYLGEPDGAHLLLMGMFGLPDVTFGPLKNTPEIEIGGIADEHMNRKVDSKPADKTSREVWQDRPGIVFKKLTFQKMFSELWAKYRPQGGGPADIGKDVIRLHALNTVASVIGYTILQNGQENDRGFRIIMPDATQRIFGWAGGKYTKEEKGNMSWDTLRRQYKAVRAIAPAMFDNVLGNLKAKMQKHQPGIFKETEYADEIEIHTAPTIIEQLEALNDGNGLSDNGAHYLYNYLHYYLSEKTLLIKSEEKKQIDDIVTTIRFDKDTKDEIIKQIKKYLEEKFNKMAFIPAGGPESAINSVRAESNSHIFSKVDQTQKHKTWRQVNETDTSRYMD